MFGGGGGSTVFWPSDEAGVFGGVGGTAVFEPADKENC